MPLPLDNAELRNFIEEAVRKKTDLLKLAEALSKSEFAPWRNQILDYIALVPKYRKKFDTNAFLTCDKLALEQSTAADIGIYKARFFDGAESVDDLCCGMGGDSFFLPQTVPVRGVDLSEERVAMYLFNTKAMGYQREALTADVRTLKSRSALFTIDSARRAKDDDNQRNFSELTPSLSEIIELAKLYKGGMAKLPPGYPQESFPAETEKFYLGAKNDCRECLLLFGSLAKNPGKTHAVFIDSFGNAHVWTSSSPTELSCGPLSNFLAEPIPVLIRSHLFPEIAQSLSPDVRLISPGIAYLTSDKSLHGDGFRNFRILGSVPLSTGKIKKLLRDHRIGKLTIKKRGVEIVPEAEIKRLSPKGENEGVLFYTRVAGEKTAILTKPV